MMNLASMNRHKYIINHQTGAVFGNEELWRAVRDRSAVALKERILSLCCARLVKMDVLSGWCGAMRFQNLHISSLKGAALCFHRHTVTFYSTVK